MIHLEPRNMAKVATGQYINLYGKDGVDMFILINEGNGHIHSSKLRSVTDYLEEVSAQYNLNDITDEDLKEELERFFPYGVQIIRR